MEENNNKEIQDVEWEQTQAEVGEIKFTKTRQNRTMRRLKIFLKGVSFILVAALSGGMTAFYIVDNTLQKNSYSSINPSLMLQTGENTKTADIPKNAINRVAEIVGPTVVGISNLAQGFGGKITQGSGSGIIFDSKGYIVTNAHVIEGSDQLLVKLSSGQELQAKLVGIDKRSDLAVIKVDAENLPVAKFGDSSKMKVGDLAIAIGNPLGQEYAGTVTSGIISALNRKIQVDNTVYKVLQTDAAINPGNSGGALCNEAGEIIGINSLKLGVEENVEGISFAISINEAKEIIRSLTETGKVIRPYLGIMGGTAAPEQNRGVKGVYITGVEAGKGASSAGIRPTDIIIEVDKVKIEKFEQLSDIVDKHKVGDTVPVKIWRNGKTVDVNVILSERPQ